MTSANKNPAREKYKKETGIDVNKKISMPDIYEYIKWLEKVINENIKKIK